MLILVIRHGEAVADAPGGDTSRYLNGRGRKRTRKVASWLCRSKSRRPVEIWVSPLVRAVQTAEIVAEHAGLEDAVSVCAELSPGRDPRDVLELLGKREASAGPIALVGHEPQLSLLVGALLGEAERAWPSRRAASSASSERKDGGPGTRSVYWVDPKGLRIVRDRASLTVPPEELPPA